MKLLWIVAVAVGCWAGFAAQAFAAERVTLTSGFEVECSRREAVGERTRLYSMGPGEAGYIEVASANILRVEPLTEAQTSAAPALTRGVATGKVQGAAPLAGMLARAGERHRIDADLLASVVKAESGGNARAVSRTGARGLMQLMPTTARAMGVADAFEPEGNITGGAAYLDQLLARYHDDVALALAAYNAGPGAVDRWHGIPPYRETRLYVAKVIGEFNRRKRLAMTLAVAVPVAVR